MGVARCLKYGVSTMRTWSATILALAACGGVESISPDGDVPDADVSDSAPVTDGAPDAAATPSIATALDCGTPASAGGLANGTDLQRVDVDLTVFPEALCNDGTGAVYYVRPAATAAGRNRWVIQFQGGGLCSTPDSCARRWCSVDTNFGMTQMTATLAPTVGTVGDGILRHGGALGEPNPVGDWNHVFLRYCSSDSWAGTAGAVDVDALHPVSGAPVRFRIEFNGSRIVDAVVATLRRAGAAPPAYTLGGGTVNLPDLDDATMVLMAGASAGSSGVTHNIDRLREHLRTHNAACQGGACPLVFWGLHDSGLKPDLATLDYSTTTMCLTSGVCDYPTSISTGTATDLSLRRSDASCRTWHAANDVANTFRCDDDDHLALHHVITPMMVRMGQTDDLVSGNLIDAAFTVPGRGLMTVPLFAELTRTQMTTLPQSNGTAEEPALSAAPRYSPPCSKHETLSNDESVFGVTVTSAGQPLTMFEVLGNALTGAAPTTAIWAMGDAVDCM